MVVEFGSLNSTTMNRWRRRVGHGRGIRVCTPDSVVCNASYGGDNIIRSPSRHVRDFLTGVAYGGGAGRGSAVVDSAATLRSMRRSYGARTLACGGGAWSVTFATATGRAGFLIRVRGGRFAGGMLGASAEPSGPRTAYQRMILIFRRPPHCGARDERPRGSIRQ